MRKKTTEEKFWSKVVVGSVMREGLGPCHLWVGAQDKDGYGQTNATGVTKRAHRIAWELQKGPAPALLRHTCDNRLCCNVEHLVPGTQQDNVRDCVTQQRQARGSRQGNARLTENVVRSVFALKRDGVPQRLIARRLGISESHCCGILKGLYWGHLGLHHA